MNKFWMVWDPHGRAPIRKHETPQLATTEAERLASIHEGQSFVVLEAISVSRALQVFTARLEQAPYDDPFQAQ